MDEVEGLRSDWTLSQISCSVCRCRKNREQFVIATKVRFSGSGDGNPNGTGLSRVRILSEVESSLRRLQTDYIDLYQVLSADSLNLSCV